MCLPAGSFRTGMATATPWSSNILRNVGCRSECLQNLGAMCRHRLHKRTCIAAQARSQRIESNRRQQTGCGDELADLTEVVFTPRAIALSFFSEVDPVVRTTGNGTFTWKLSYPYLLISKPPTPAAVVAVGMWACGHVGMWACGQRVSVVPAKRHVHIRAVERTGCPQVPDSLGSRSRGTPAVIEDAGET